MKTSTKILFIILTLILCATSLYAYKGYRNDLIAKSIEIQEISNTLSDYQSQILELQDQLRSHHQQEIVAEDITCKENLSLAFVLSSSADIDTIIELAGKYDFSPVLILDLSFSYYQLKEIVSALKNTDYEIAFSCSPFSKDALARLESIHDHMRWNNISINESSVFLLMDEDDNADNRDAITEAGFSTILTSYIKVEAAFLSEASEDDISSLNLPFAMIKDAENDFTETTQWQKNNHYPVLYCFDLRDGGVSTEQLSENLEYLDYYVKDGQITYCSWNNGFGDYLTYYSEIKAANDGREAYLEEEEAIKEQIEALEAEMEEFYNSRNDK